MQLSNLIVTLREADLLIGVQESFDDVDIDHLAGDSRQVGPNGLFVAIRGETADGHLFIDKAVQNGARAIVCEAVPADRDDRYAGIAFVHVEDSRAALAELASVFYDHPSRDLNIVGVTGTNGKTTVTFLIYSVLTLLDARAGLIGTIEIRLGDRVIATRLTTPDALAVQRLLRGMAEAGCAACAMEVSSHALEQARVRAVAFDAAVFTNLSRDHLDYHKTPEAYLSAKKKLFDALEPGAVALYNADDPAGSRMVADTRAERRSYGLDAPADIRAHIVENRMDGLTLKWKGRDRRFRLVGRFNAYNLLAAYGAVCALGYEPNAVLEVLEQAPPVPGRFELIRFEDGTKVVVDYAHTPDALENVLRTIAETKDPAAEVWCVFGCGGDRDREKRPLMGSTAERYADHLIVTSDNPRTEDPASIMKAIRGGMSRAEHARFIADRREAIAEAARASKAGDIVLVAGKGHEPYQIIGTEARPFDDRQVVREVFAPRNAAPPPGRESG